MMQADTILSDDSAMKEVVGLIREGGVMGYPTETVYGLGGDPFSLRAIERIRLLKERDARKLFLLLISDRKMLRSCVETPSPDAIKLMDAFWPGPLTLIFLTQHVFPRSLTGDDGKIGLRMSPDPFCQGFVEALGRPLISTSANPSDRPPARSADEVVAYFGDRIDLVVDGGKRGSGTVSTVIDVAGAQFRLLREGAVSRSKIENIVGEIDGS